MKALCILLTLAAGGMATQAVAASVVTVDIGADATPAEVAAIKRTQGKDEISVLPVLVGHADLNGDHRPDLILRTRNTALCGSAIGCATGAILATPNGYAHQLIGLAGSGDVDVFMLPTLHNRMHDLRFEGSSHVFKWNGKKYQ
jgi:hypothetical protein